VPSRISDNLYPYKDEFRDSGSRGRYEHEEEQLVVSNEVDAMREVRNGQ
jgi:hypothetical protein